MNNYVLTVTCPSTRGIVAAISGYLAAEGCNIIDSSQYDDLDTGRFFIRISWRIFFPKFSVVFLSFPWFF